MALEIRLSRFTASSFWTSGSPADTRSSSGRTAFEAPFAAQGKHSKIGDGSGRRFPLTVVESDQARIPRYARDDTRARSCKSELAPRKARSMHYPS